MSTVPAGFETTKAMAVFQNPANWTKAGEVGRMVQGIYEGRLEQPDNYGNKNHRFTATADGISFDKEGLEVPYSAGQTIILNSAGGLNFRLAPILPGTEVIVDFDGKIEIKDGNLKGKSANSYSVYAKPVKSAKGA